MPSHYWIWKLLSSGTEAQTGHFHWGQLPWAYHWSILYPRKQLNHLQHSQRSSRTTHQQVTVSDSSLAPTLQISVSLLHLCLLSCSVLLCFSLMCVVVVPDAISLTHLPNIISNTGMGEEVCLLLCPLSIAIRVVVDDDDGHSRSPQRWRYRTTKTTPQACLKWHWFCICLTMNSLQTCPEWRKVRMNDDHEERRVLRKLAYGLKAL